MNNELTDKEFLWLIKMYDGKIIRIEDNTNEIVIIQGEVIND
jgi:hypothetical protein